VPLRDEDTEALWLLTNHPTITTRFHILPTPFTIADAEALVRVGREGRTGFMGAWDRQLGQLVGVVGAELRDDDKVEFAYWIGIAFQGKGYATEAAAGIVATLGRMFPDRQVIAECKPENKISWRVLEKLGFRSTGLPGHREGRELLTRGEAPISPT
jgi:RimJ/RimL family protein N-acetyltransferase